MTTMYWSLLMGCLLSLVACNSPKNKGKTIDVTRATTSEKRARTTKGLNEYSKAYFASGCFWCVEAIFESVKGVEEAVSGYAGGTETNPTYEQVSRGATGHAEAVEVYYNPKIIDYKTLVKVYYASHDPTTINGQSPDFGKQYRSMILYTTEKEKAIAEAYKAALDASGAYDASIATEIEPLTHFWKAEDYHQNYERNHPGNRYIQGVSIPRLKRFQAKYPELLKNDTH